MADRLVSRVTRYKKGTAQLVTWLVESARKVDATLQIQEPIPAKQLEAYAEIITSAKRPASIPERILVVLQDVIDGRSACAQYFMHIEEQTKATTAADSRLARQNSGHRYFIDVLQAVLNKLKHAFDKSRANKPKGMTSGQKVINTSLANVFECLELFDPTPSNDSQSGKAPMRGQSTTERQHEYILDTADEDIALEIWSHIKDLAAVREFVKSTWQEFYQGKISAAVALPRST